MSRGRKVRVATATLPPKGCYMSHMAPLIAAREQRVLPSTVHLREGRNRGKVFPEMYFRKFISSEMTLLRRRRLYINTIPPPPPLPPPPPGDFTGNELPPIAALARFPEKHGAFSVLDGADVRFEEG